MENIQSGSLKNLAAALSKFHVLMKGIEKDKINPRFNSKYASLDSILSSIKEPLHKAGLVIIPFPSVEMCGDIERNRLTTILIHIESGEQLTYSFNLMVTADLVSSLKTELSPQKLGSAITYAMRQSLSTILMLSVDDDDDGNLATPAQSKPKTYQKPSYQSFTKTEDRKDSIKDPAKEESKKKDDDENTIQANIATIFEHGIDKLGECKDAEEAKKLARTVWLDLNKYGEKSMLQKHSLTTYMETKWRIKQQ